MNPALLSQHKYLKCTKGEQKKVKKGLYKYFNHPMHIGISAVMIGLAIANASWQGLIFYNLILLPVLIIRSRAEEKILINS